MAILFFDTETTGLPLWKESDKHPGQPHIIQLAAIVASEEGQEWASFKTLIQPAGWEIAAEAQATHGITAENCRHYGIPIGAAIDLLHHLSVPSVHTVVAHNIDFDARMVVIELLRIGADPNMLYRNGADGYCTMNRSTELCKLPGKYGYKWPKLAEAYEHFFKEPLSGAHDAMVDVRACMRIFFHLRSLETA